MKKLFLFLILLFSFSIINAKGVQTKKYNHIVSLTLSGDEILKFNDDIKGRLIVAGYKSTTILESIKMDDNTVLIVGNRHSIIEHAVKCGVKLIIITGGFDVKEEHLKIAMENGVNIIIYEPMLNLSEFDDDIKIENNFEKFMEISDVILANRMDEKIMKFKDKVYTRDLFGRDWIKK